MRSSENRVVIACAGSGKTTRLVEEALNLRGRRIAIVTYTNNNTREIIRRFGALNSGVPKHVEIMTWFGFLLRECARPYQRSKYAGNRIESLLFVNGRSARGIAESDTRRHYFANGKLVYSDKIAKFVVECERESHGSVTSRLEQIYTDVFIDEFQDLAGWDLDVISMLLHSGVRVTMVGDPRQHIYSTNSSGRKKQFRGVDLVKVVGEWERQRTCVLEHMGGTYRCGQAICEFANGLWPGMEAMESLANDTAGHAGVFLVDERAVADYLKRFRPQVLRYNARGESYGSEALNFGIAKGLEFDHVLIVPTRPMAKYLETGELQHLMTKKGSTSKDKLHVAVTRARYSVAFVCGGQSPVVPRRFP